MADDNNYKLVPPPPIAIVGMAMRLPAGVNNSDDFWDLLVNGKDGRCRVPGDRYNADAFLSVKSATGQAKNRAVGTQYGYFLQEDILRYLDASFFSMGKAEVERLDPQQKLLLEVVWECLENAGQTGWRGKDIGFYVGVFGEDWLDLHAKDAQERGKYRITGSSDFVLGNRMSYEYDFKGPSMTIKTGCSSSLICLHLACQAIYNGDCSAAIVGGTNLIMSPTMTGAVEEQEVLSRTGSCKSFDARADGYARGEAVNAIYVKKLSDALHDRDPVRAVIRATATNCDGKTPSIVYPSSETHEALIHRAYHVAGLHDYAETAFVECHGTGTPIGDPLEAHAIANVFGESGIYIGSVKPNVGHSEGASGITSIIKAVLALEKKTIPPNINFLDPNPKIPFGSGKLQVPVEAVPWPESRSERVSVNSFGIGGANAHAILDSAASFTRHPTTISQFKGGSLCSRLLVFSANHPDSLRKLISNYQQYVEENPLSLDDLAYTLSVRREHLSHRAFCVTNGDVPLDVSSFSKSKASSEIVFVFTGQGSQWAQMGKELMEEYSAFSDDIKAMDDVLAELPGPPGWTIQNELLRPQTSSHLYESEFSQPLCTAVQVALVNLLRTWGVSPTTVVGHSSGEIAAAYACGAITAVDSVIISYHRGQSMKYRKQAGGMVAVGLGRQDISPYLVNGVVIACENSLSSITLSGDELPLHSIIERLKVERPETFVRRLHVDMAYHSHHMISVGEDYWSRITGHISSRRPAIPFYSTVTGDRVDGQHPLASDYWRQNLESPVLFNTAITAILDGSPQSTMLFVEIGPHPTLLGPLRQIFKAAGTTSAYHVPTLVRDVSGVDCLLKTAGHLYLHGVPLHFPAISPAGSVLTNLPCYPWNHEKIYWSESRISREWRLRRFPHHEILGSRVLESNDVEPTWRNMLRLEDARWIRDHIVLNDVLFPAAGYIAMAGEAIRQIKGSDNYIVRHVVIKSALVLVESKETEVMTSFRPARLTDSLDSAWYDFSILSYNGTAWTRNCVGQAKGGSTQAIPNTPTAFKSDTTPAIEPLPRAIPSPRWYQATKKIGLKYGPVFSGLKDISAGVKDQTAVGTISNETAQVGSPYQLHPATIDTCLQLLCVAASRGIPRSIVQLCVPTYIEELHIRRAPHTIRAKAVASTNSKGRINGDATALAEGEVVLRLKGLQLSPLNSADATRHLNPYTAAELEWKPDIDSIDLRELIRPCKGSKELYLLLEKLALLCMIETRQKLSSCQPSYSHLTKYRAWVESQVDRAEQGDYALVPDARDLLSLNSQDRKAILSATYKEVQRTEAYAVGRAILQVFEFSEDIFEGHADPLKLLREDDLLTEVSYFASRWDFKEPLQLLCHSNPNLKILEIEAGTGATTAMVLDGLTSPHGVRMYSTYTYTDVSAGFFVEAKERFKHAHGMEFATLDITKDPIDQGFGEGAYDLILAANVIHTTPSISQSLQNVRKLLSPRGRLILQELCTMTKIFNYITGVLPRWWIGEDDGRQDEPYISTERWDQELRSTGFSGVGTVIYDHDPPYHVKATMVITPADITTTSTKTPRRITLLYSSTISPLIRQVESCLITQGFGVDFCTLSQETPAGQDIIALLDLEGPFLHDITPDTFNEFIRWVANLESVGVLWVTRSAQVRCEDPRYALVLGLARTIRTELLVDFATLELDKTDAAACAAIARVLSKFQRRCKASEFDPDFEYALSNGVIHTSRFRWISVTQQLSQDLPDSLPKKLVIGQPGLLKTLRWIQLPHTALKRDEVEVDIRAVGVNFKVQFPTLLGQNKADQQDILIAMGTAEGEMIERVGLGCEGSGIIRRVGPDVRDFNIGDRVFVLQSGTFCTPLVIESGLCIKIPDDLSFANAATMPVVYSTVISSLIDVGRLEPGQTVLIHSACGGIGLAAIQICQMIGAIIFATVGTEGKVEYLMNQCGISRRRIFNSRNDSFLLGVMQETENRGVDIVLNSLSGELLHASWQCVAEFGKMVEIGKRDLIGRGKLSMDPFEGNRTYAGADFAGIFARRPDTARRLFRRCVDLYREGAIKPIPSITLFGASQVEDAFRCMQKGQHIGKIVVTMPEDPRTLPISPVAHELRLRSNASYLLPGGLGGLGRAVSIWMVENGATNLIYLSRSAGSPVDVAFFNELRCMGCSVQAFAGSVDDMRDVKNVVAMAAKPIAGVIQMSMVLRDRELVQMTHDDWKAAISPKVRGTLNLHEALAAHELDFFVLFSSLAGTRGWAEQANYASSNTFLDAFVQFRHRMGLPASVLVVSAVEDVGYVSEKAILERFRAAGIHTLREPDLLESLQLSIERSVPPPESPDLGFANPSQIVTGLSTTKPPPSSWVSWKRDIRMAAYKNLETEETSTSTTMNEGLREFLMAVATKPHLLDAQSSIDLLTHEIGIRLYSFMLLPEEELDATQPLSAIGMDSLVAIEVRNWWHQNLGFEISVFDILNAGSIEQMGELAVEGLRAKLGGSATAP